MPLHPLISRLFAPSVMVAMCFCLPSIALAQKQESKKENATPTFSLSFLNCVEEGGTQLYYNKIIVAEDGKEEKSWESLPPSSLERTETLKVSLTPPVQLAIAKTKGDKVEMVPFLDIPAKTPKDQFLVIRYLDEQGKEAFLVLDDSEKAHPSKTVRMLNLTQDRIAFSVGGETIPVAPGASGIATPQFKNDHIFPFTYFVEVPGEKPYKAPTKPRDFSAYDRMLAIYNVQVETVPTGEKDAQGNEIIEKIAEKKVLYSLESTPSKQDTSDQKKKPEKIAKEATSEESTLIQLIPVGFEVPAGTKIGVEWGTGGQTVQVEVPSGQQPIYLKGPKSDKITLKSDKGLVLGSAPLGSLSDEYILIAETAKDTTGTVLLRLTPIESSPQAHPLGKVRIVNLTTYQVGHSVGEGGQEVGYINPHDNAVVGGSPKEMLKLAVKAPAGWQQLSDSKALQEAGSKRKTVIVYPTPGKDGFSVLEK